MTGLISQDIFADPRSLAVFWGTFASALEPLDWTNPAHQERLHKARSDLSALGYGGDAVELFVNECFRAEPLN
jgi:hypothetical protein